MGEGEMVMVPFGRVARADHDPKTGFGKGGRPKSLNDNTSEENGTTMWEGTVTSLKPDETLIYQW